MAQYIQPSFESLVVDNASLKKFKKEAQLSAYNLLCLLDRSNHSQWRGYTYVGHQIATAESLTAGLITSTLVDIPWGGYLKYGCLGVYDTDAKRTFLGVKIQDVYTHKCAKEMAIGVLKNSNASIAVAVTGNAMPLNEHFERLSETFISVAGYVVNEKGETEMHYITKSVNACLESENLTLKTICEDWYHKIASDSLRRTYNERSKTAIVSQLIRYYIVKASLDLAREFITDHKLVVPEFLIEAKQENERSNVPESKYKRELSEICTKGGCEDSRQDVRNGTNIKTIRSVRHLRGPVAPRALSLPRSSAKRSKTFKRTGSLSPNVKNRSISVDTPFVKKNVHVITPNSK
jgi:nicotinamide mononucleotide (NMN) deamidase PncC